MQPSIVDRNAPHRWLCWFGIHHYVGHASYGGYPSRFCGYVRVCRRCGRCKA